VSARNGCLRYHTSVTTYHIENFGCRATQADGAELALQFKARGLAPATATEADIVLLNTCTVTSSADRDARAAIRRVQRENPLAKIVVTGCYAQRAPLEIAALPGVSAVIGNSHKHQLADLVLGESAWERILEQDFLGDGSFFPISRLARKPAKAQEAKVATPVWVSDIFAHTELLAAPVFDSAQTAGSREERIRPNLKVQDGCDNRCSFCVIPSVRGHSRSLPFAKVIDQMNTLVAAGYREVVVSGINLGRWGRDLEEEKAYDDGLPTFESLLRAILAQTNLEKLRISSVEPMDWTDELISLVADSPRIAKHAHVPLQSGSDAVLRRMHRKYRPWHYRQKIEQIHSAMPAAAIGADVMTGFPGESEAEFESTCSFIEDLPFTYLHVFTYSARPGTRAAAMPHQVPVHVARERNKILSRLAEKKKQAFMRSLIGKKLQAITLGATRRSSGGLFSEALTDNYQKLYLHGELTPNRWIAAHVEGVEDGAMVGRLDNQGATL